MNDADQERRWDIGDLPASLAVHIPERARIVTLDYYEGPFQEFEEAVTAGMDWDIAPSLAILPPTGGDMIELCAGAGRLTAPLSTVARSLTAIERSPFAAARLRARFAADPKVRIVTGDLADHRPPSKVDIVTLLGLSIHVLPWPMVERAIARAAEWLRPRGSFCVNVMADDVVDKLASRDELVRRRRYLDRAGVEREMLTTTRFHPMPRMLEQYWMVPVDGGVAAARMRSQFRSAEQVEETLAAAGFRIDGRAETPIEGGAGAGAGVVFLRANRS